MRVPKTMLFCLSLLSHCFAQSQATVEKDTVNSSELGAVTISGTGGMDIWCSISSSGSLSSGCWNCDQPPEKDPSSTWIWGQC